MEQLVDRAYGIVLLRLLVARLERRAATSGRKRLRMATAGRRALKFLWKRPGSPSNWRVTSATSSISGRVCAPPLQISDRCSQEQNLDRPGISD